MKRFVLSLLCIFALFSNTTYALIPNDPDLVKQWYLDKANVYGAWDYTTGSSSVVVAVIDSGVDIDHIDLIDNIWINPKEIPNNGIDDDGDGYVDDTSGWDFVDNDNNPNPDIDISCIAEKKCSLEGVNHGTVISGVIAALANNSQGISGIAPNVKIMPLKVLGSSGGGNIDDVIKAINYAKNNGASIINMSFIGDSDSSLLRKAMDEAGDTGIIFVVAAGNNPQEGGTNLNTNPLYPVCTDFNTKFVFGVAALDKSNNKASFSNYGSNCVNISAPGVSIYSTTVYKPDHSSFNNYYNGYWAGTSVATPIVSAAVALVKSINLNFTNEEIFNIILESADDLANLDIGKKINVENAIKLAVDKTKKEGMSFDIITGAGIGDDAVVKIIKNNGYEVSSFLAYPKNFRGGVNVAYADVNGDFEKEIITIPASSGGSHIRVFKNNGKNISNFFAFDKSVRGGYSISTGDFNGYGENNIVVGSPVGIQSAVKIYDYFGNLKNTIFPYKNFTGGVNVSACDLNNDGVSEIITAPASSGGPHIMIFNNVGKYISNFFAFDKSIRGGYSISCFDINGDYNKEIIVSKSKSSIIAIFDNNGKQVLNFDSFSSSFSGDVNISAFSSRDGFDSRILIAPKNKNGAQLRIFNSSGGLVSQFFVYNSKLRGGMSFVAND